MENFKKTVLCFFCIFFASSLLNAQIKVESIGRVQVGTEPTYPGHENDGDNVASAQIFGKYSPLASGSKLTFGDFGRQSLQGWNVFVGEYGTTDTDQLWLHGKNGIYFTYSNGPVIAYYDVNAGNAFYFNCDVYSNGIKLTSDERLKENIKPLKGSLSSLQQLDGVSYYLKTAQSKIDAKKAADGTGVLSEKEAKDKAFFENWEKELENSKETRIGFLAQDLRKVYPELVSEDKKGMLSVDYMGLIPVIVESIKEQQQIINAQSEKIKELEDALNHLNGGSGLRSGANDASTTGLNNIPTGNVANSFLYQNAPNPFKEKTEIRYFLPENVQSAEIYVFDMQGGLLKRIPAVKSGFVEIKGSDLRAGMYLYALIVDGKQVDTKRMILTK